MQLFKDFGFEPTFFVAQIINFLILAFVFQKFLYKPLLKLLKDRERKIAKGLEDADSAHLALENANAQKDEIIRKATAEAEKIIEETKVNAEKTREEMLTASKKEADRIIQESKEAAVAEMKKAEIAAQDMALDLARKLLDRILSEMFTKQEKERILERNIKVLDKYE